MAERQLFVIEARQVQDRGVQVVHVADVLHRVNAELVRIAVGYAAFRAAARQEDTEPLRVMVTPIRTGGVRGAAELARPQDQRTVQEAPLLQIADQRSHSPVGLLRVLLVPRLQPAVLVPRPVRESIRAVDLNEPNTRLDKPACPQALPRVEPRIQVRLSRPYISCVAFDSFVSSSTSGTSDCIRAANS